MKKEFVPFREREQLVRSTWPNGARLAVAIYIAIEQWNWDNVIKYKARPPLTPPLLPDMKRVDLSIETNTEYGIRVGIWRLIEIFESFGIKPSLLSNGLAIERYPKLFEELDSMGYTIVLHAYEQSRYLAQLSDEEVKEDIGKCVKIAREVTGKQPLGWGSPGTRQYEEIFDELLDEGFKYHMGLHDDELPYYIETNSGRRIVEIPYRIGDTGELNDYFMFWQGETRMPSECYAYIDEFFSARYEEAAKRPAFVSYGMHPFVSGRPDRAKVIRYFLEYIQRFHDIWIAGNFDEIYSWWDKQLESSFKGKLRKE